MGNINFGLPSDLVLSLLSQFKLGPFVETGMFRGDTTEWAASHFQKVFATEIMPESFYAVKKRLADHSNVECLLGESSSLLRDLVPRIEEPALFWLDAHWMGEGSAPDSECPLIEELSEIAKSPHAHFILIDDARLFMSPPPRPLRPHKWPTIDHVCRQIQSGPHEYYIVIWDDAIIAVPDSARVFLKNYLQEANTSRWETMDRYSRRSDVVKGFRLLGQGTRLVSGPVGRKLTDPIVDWFRRFL